MFAPNPVTPGASVAMSTMTVNTAAVPPRGAPWPQAPPPVLLWVTALGLALVTLGMARRRIPQSRYATAVGLALLLVVLAAGQASCRSSRHLFLGPHTITVTATSGNSATPRLWSSTTRRNRPAHPTHRATAPENSSGAVGCILGRCAAALSRVFPDPCAYGTAGKCLKRPGPFYSSCFSVFELVPRPRSSSRISLATHRGPTRK